MPSSKSRKAGKKIIEKKGFGSLCEGRLREILTLAQLISIYLLFIYAVVVSTVGVQKYKVWSLPPKGLS